METGSPVDELALTMARVNSLLLSEETVDRAITQLAAAAKQVMPGALGAGVSLINSRGQKTSTGYTDDVVSILDELQYAAGEGPCLSAWASNRPVVTEDLSKEERWPNWTSAAAAQPVRSVVSVPLAHGSEVLGALKVYAAQPEAFDRRSQRLLVNFAEPAAILLSHVQSAELPAQLSSALQSALHSRNKISVATGVLMERVKVDEESALRMMLHESHTRAIPLLQVAEDLVAKRPWNLA